MKHLLIPCVLSALCLSALPSAADVSVSLIPSAPENNILAQYLIADGQGGGYQWRNDVANGRRDLGQSFLSDIDASMTAFGLQLWGNYQGGVGGAAGTLSIWKLANSTALPTATGSVLLSTQDFVMPTLTGGAGQFINFSIEEVQLQKDNYYLFMISFDDTAANRNLVFRSLEVGQYPDGNTYNGTLSGESMTYVRMGSDLSFYVTATPIPEPSMALLLPAVAGAFLMLRRRRR